MVGRNGAERGEKVHFKFLEFSQYLVVNSLIFVLIRRYIGNL